MPNEPTSPDALSPASARAVGGEAEKADDDLRVPHASPDLRPIELDQHFELLKHGLGQRQKLLFEELIRDFFENGTGLNWRDIEQKVYVGVGDHDSGTDAIQKLPRDLADKIAKDPTAYKYGRRIWVEAKPDRPKPQRYRINVEGAGAAPHLPGIKNNSVPFFPEMRWGKPGGEMKSLGLSVVGVTRYSLELCISPRGWWRPPKGLKESDYNVFADDAWRAAQPKGKSPYHNSNLWSVGGFVAHPSLFSGMDALSIDVNRVTHRDYGMRPVGCLVAGKSVSV